MNDGALEQANVLAILRDNSKFFWVGFIEWPVVQGFVALFLNAFKMFKVLEVLSPNLWFHDPI